MGRLQRFAVKARSARGAVALGGAAVLAVGLAQATGTLAQTTAQRTATLPLASANYFPTPLTSWVTCVTDPDGDPAWNRRARISWAPVQGATGYRMELVRKENGQVWRTQDVPATQTSIGDIADSDRLVLYARVRTINNSAVSSGYTSSNTGLSFKNWVNLRTECENDSRPSLPNQQSWENQKAWTPGTMFRMAGAQGGLVSLLSEMEPEEEAAALAPESELTTLEEAAKEAPATTEASTSSEESSAAGTTEEAPATSTSTERPSTSVQTSAPRSTTTRTSTPSSTPRSTQTSTSAPSTSTSAAPVRRTAGVGDDAIAVGTSFAQLDEVGGDTQVTVSSGGAEVCTVPVPGATRIENSGGTLEVTVAGETYRVDTSTCEVS